MESNLIQQLMDIMEEVMYEIFLELHKAYDTLDCDSCLNILEAYGVVPQALRLLWCYWYNLTMVAQVRG